MEEEEGKKTLSPPQLLHKICVVILGILSWRIILIFFEAAQMDFIPMIESYFLSELQSLLPRTLMRIQLYNDRKLYSDLHLHCVLSLEPKGTWWHQRPLSWKTPLIPPWCLQGTWISNPRDAIGEKRGCCQWLFLLIVYSVVNKVFF